MSEHSVNSASRFEADMLCPGRRAMTQDEPRSTSVYAAWGTAAHNLAEDCLSNSAEPEGFVGRVFKQDGFSVEVDDEMAECVRTYIDNVREMAGDGLLMVEKRVYYNDALGTEPAQSFGTADALVIRGNELQVHDLKAGRGVAVDARGNAQMMLYALGALQLLRDAGAVAIDVVRLVIHQPRIRPAPSEWYMRVEDLRTWAAEARRARESIDGATASRVALSEPEWQAMYLRPNETSCRFCAAKATCPALKANVMAAAMEGFL